MGWPCGYEPGHAADEVDDLCAASSIEPRIWRFQVLLPQQPVIRRVAGDAVRRGQILAQPAEGQTVERSTRRQMLARVQPGSHGVDPRRADFTAHATQRAFVDAPRGFGCGAAARHATCWAMVIRPRGPDDSQPTAS